MSRELAESIMRMNEILDSLKSLGISPEQAEKLSSIMDEYAELKEELPQQRQSQFKDTAYDVLISMKAVTNKNIDTLSAYLRKFAEHVLRHAYSVDPSVQNIRDIRDLVDRIPHLSVEEEKFAEEVEVEEKF